MGWILRSIQVQKLIKSNCKKKTIKSKINNEKQSNKNKLQTTQSKQYQKPIK